MSNDLPDKKFLWGRYQEREDWRGKLHKKVAHKSLDIPEDEDVNVDNSRVQQGITWKELGVIGGLILGGFYLFSEMRQPTKDSAPTQSAPVDSEYEVRFFDANGNPIEIQPLANRKPSQG